MEDHRLVFFGTNDVGVPVLEHLIDAGYDLVAVVTKPDAPSGRGRTLTAPEVKIIAEKAGIPVLQPEQLDDDFAEELSDLNPTAGILVSYGKIVPEEVLELFPQGIINIHPSLLPKYRGSSPIEQAILNGDRETGVSIMLLDEGMDTGPVYLSVKLPLTGKETKPKLYDQLSQLGAITLVEHLEDILGGDISATPQDDDEASVAPRISKQDGVIDWSKPAEQLEREVRAYLGWPGSRTTLFERDVIVTAASVDEESELELAPGETKPVDGTILVGTGSGILKIEYLQPVGKNQMTAADFLRGLRL